jgi:hypothetical protein
LVGFYVYYYYFAVGANTRHEFHVWRDF